MARETILREAVAKVKDDFDYVFIDCPPSLGLLTINALVAATSLMIPIQCEYYALEGVAKLLESMQMVKRRMNPDLEIFGVVMTMFDSRTTLSKQVVDEVRSYFGNKVFKTVIPQEREDLRVAESRPPHQPVRAGEQGRARVREAREGGRRPWLGRRASGEGLGLLVGEADAETAGMRPDTVLPIK